MMNNCDELPMLFSLELDNELDEAGRGRMNRHLVNCNDCASLFTHMRAVDRMFRNAPMKYAPMGFTERTVNAAFNSDLRRNVGIGLGILLMGTVILSSLFLLGRVEILWLVVSAIIAPGFVANSTTWFNELVTALSLGGRALWSTLEVVRAMISGPLVVPSLMTILAGAFMYLFVQRNGTRDSISA
jgi:hypothetical protein